MPPPDTAPSVAAIWSAVAASCSAFAALTIMFIHRRNLLESARPEIVLTSWARVRPQQPNSSGFDRVVYKGIRNVGRGLAHDVVVHASGTHNGKLLYVGSLEPVPIIPAGECAEVNGEVMLLWNELPEMVGGKLLRASVVAKAWDSRGRRHETTTHLLICQSEQSGVAGASMVAPGVYLSHRETKTDVVWWLKTKCRLSKLMFWRASRNGKQTGSP